MYFILQNNRDKVQKGHTFLAMSIFFSLFLQAKDMSDEKNEDNCPRGRDGGIETLL